MNAFAVRIQSVLVTVSLVWLPAIAQAGITTDLSRVHFAPNSAYCNPIPPGETSVGRDVQDDTSCNYNRKELS